MVDLSIMGYAISFSPLSDSSLFLLSADGVGIPKHFFKCVIFVDKRRLCEIK